MQEYVGPTDFQPHNNYKVLNVYKTDFFRYDEPAMVPIEGQYNNLLEDR